MCFRRDGLHNGLNICGRSMNYTNINIWATIAVAAFFISVLALGILSLMGSKIKGLKALWDAFSAVSKGVGLKSAGLSWLILGVGIGLATATIAGGIYNHNRLRHRGYEHIGSYTNHSFSKS